MEEKNNKWEVKDYEIKYKQQVLSLLKKYFFESGVGEEDFFDWQNSENPAGNSTIKLAINDGDEVVGLYCVIPQKYRIGGKNVLGSVSLNTLVREDYRKMGIFTKLAEDCFWECQKRGIEFTLGFPNPNSYPGFVRRLNFDELKELPLLIKPYKLSNLLASKLKVSFLKYLFWPVDFCLGFRGGGGESGNIVFEMKKEEINNLWKRNKKYYKNIALRDGDFLDWRMNCPNRNYKYLGYKKRGKLLGYMVLGLMETSGLKNGLVVDFLLKRKGKWREVGRELLVGADRYWRKRGVDQVGFLTTKNNFEFDVMRKNGFVSCPDFLKPQPMKVVLRWHGKKRLFGFRDTDKWFLTMFDYDVA